MKGKIFVFATILLILLGIVFRTEIVNFVLTTEVTSQRPTINLLDQNLIKQLTSSEISNSSIDEILHSCLRITSRNLRFRKNAISTNPNQLREKRDTHCVGFAAFLNSLIDKALKENKLSTIYQSNHVRARLYFFGIELTNNKNNFWKDHDFVQVTNLETGSVYRIDPSLYEFFRIGILESRN